MCVCLPVVCYPYRQPPLVQYHVYKKYDETTKIETILVVNEFSVA